MSDAYDLVARGKLKLKTDTESRKIKKKRKKDKKKERERLDRGVRQEQETYDEEQRIAAVPKVQQMTKAELSFKKMQEKMVNNDGKINLTRIFKSTLYFCFVARETHNGEGSNDSQTEGREIQRAFGQPNRAL